MERVSRIKWILLKSERRCSNTKGSTAVIKTTTPVILIVTLKCYLFGMNSKMYIHPTITTPDQTTPVRVRSIKRVIYRDEMKKEIWRSDRAI
jgi:hypothetical protein